MDILKNITGVSLQSSTYGEDINQRFENIDDNFEKIISSDYLKGSTGDSIKVYECELNPDDPTSAYSEGFIYIKGRPQSVSKRDLYEMIYNTLTNNIPEKALATIGDVNWCDNFSTMNKILLICESIRGKDYIISSLPYLYIDNRFANINWDQRKSYVDLIDLTSYVGWDSKTNNFAKLNANQTLYYNSEIDSFCWVMNGVNTSIPANGAKGKNGHNGIVYIVRPSRSDNGQDVPADENNLISIGEVFIFDEDKKEYRFEYLANTDIKFENGDTAICFYTEHEDDDPTTYFIISPLHTEDGVNWYTYKSLSNSISTIYDTKVFKSALVGIANSQILPGLFVPASKLNSDGIQMGHMMWVDKGNLVDAEKKVLNVALVDNIDATPTNHSGQIEPIMNVDYKVYTKRDLHCPNIKIGDMSQEVYTEITNNSLKIDDGFSYKDKSLSVNNLNVAQDLTITGNVKINGSITNEGSIENDTIKSISEKLEWMNSISRIQVKDDQVSTLENLTKNIIVWGPGGEDAQLRLWSKDKLDSMLNKYGSKTPDGQNNLLMTIYIDAKEFNFKKNDTAWIHNGAEVTTENTTDAKYEVKSGQVVLCRWTGASLYTYTI